MPKAQTKAVITADSPQVVTQYKPLPSMIVWLDTAIRLGSDSPVEIEKECHISRQSWYRWLDAPGFEDWYFEEYKKKRRRWLPSLDTMGLKHAKKGDYQFWRDMNKKAGENLEQASSVQVNVLNQIKKDKGEFDL